MQTKYAYIHPISREYVYVTTIEELISQLTAHAVTTYIEHYCNGQPYTVVEVQDDGTEKWYTPKGTKVPSPAEMAVEMEALMRYRKSFEEAVDLPITQL